MPGIGRNLTEARSVLLGQTSEVSTLQQPDIEEAGETLEELGAVWASAPKKIQREMLKVIFEAVHVDVLGGRHDPDLQALPHR
jgi:hypothetical protein